MKHLLIIILVAGLSSNVFSTDSITVERKERPGVENLKKGKVYPHYYHTQFAGNMGLFSFGGGYKIFKGKLNFGYQYGFLPPKVGGVFLSTNTFKLFYNPWLDKPLKNKFTYDPLVVGMNLIKTSGGNVQNGWEDWYPDDYYPWNPANNYAFFFGSNINYIPQKEKALKWTAYYELGVNSRLIELWWDNKRTIRFADIWNISLGVRVTIR